MRSEIHGRRKEPSGTKPRGCCFFRKRTTAYFRDYQTKRATNLKFLYDNASQFVALQWLFEIGDMTIGDLSNKMYLAFSTTTDLIDRMERSELVQRVRDEQDRRVVRIHLLKEGERIIEEVIDKRQQYLKDVLKQFDQDEAQTLSTLLAKLHLEMKKN